MTLTSLVVDVKCCARCGMDHNERVFVELRRPSGKYTHWVICPESQEPILLKIKRDKLQ